MTVYIYVFLLSNNKYYVGKSKTPTIRIEEHFTGNGSEWTKKYLPIKIIELIPNCDNYDEDKYVLKYMEIYGIDNVRGGSFSQINLTLANRSTITQMINGSTDKCFSCGKNGHFYNQCPSRFKPPPPTTPRPKKPCSRCGKFGHELNDCYSKTDVSGNILNTPYNIPLNPSFNNSLHNRDSGFNRFFRRIFNIFRK
jgi:hypothetical protein